MTCVIPTGCGGVRDVEIIAHRGESYEAPENTLAAIDLAWERDADAVELDINLTSDAKILVIHDKDTLRVTGGEGRGGTKRVVRETTAEELRKLDVGRWKSPRYAGERIPTLDEVFATLPEGKGKRLLIEVKVGPEAAALLIEEIKHSARPPEQTAVISFNLDTCAEVKRLMPELQVYYISDFKPDRKTDAPPRTIDELIQLAKNAGLDGLDLAHQGPLDAASVKRIHNAGLKCYVWTVDDPEIAKRLINAGVDGIATNRVQWMRDKLGLR